MQVLEGFLFVYNLCPNIPAGIEIEFVDFEWFWNIPSVMWIGVDLHLYFWGIEWNWSFRVEFYRDDVYGVCLLAKKLTKYGMLLYMPQNVPQNTNIFWGNGPCSNGGIQKTGCCHFRKAWKTLTALQAQLLSCVLIMCLHSSHSSYHNPANSPFPINPACSEGRV